MEATRGRRGVGSGWDVAVELAEQIADGTPLPVLASTVLLDPGEILHADVGAFGWRFQAIDVFYEEPRILAFGGPVLFEIGMQLPDAVVPDRCPGALEPDQEPPVGGQHAQLAERPPLRSGQSLRLSSRPTSR